MGANQNRDTPLPLDEPRAFNPPAGAILDYFLPATPGSGHPGDRGRQGAGGARLPQRCRRPSGRRPSNISPTPGCSRPRRCRPAPGHNRFVWDLRGPRPRALEYEYSIAAVPGADTPELPQGLFALPGTYQVRLTADGKTLTQPLKVAMDPRVKTPAADLAAQHEMYVAVSEALARVTDAQEQVEEVANRLKTLDGELAGRADAGSLRQAAERVTAAVETLRAGPGEDNLAAVAAVLGPLATDLEGADRAPSGPQREVFEIYRKRLDAALAKWQALRNGECATSTASARGRIGSGRAVRREYRSRGRR